MKTFTTTLLTFLAHQSLAQEDKANYEHFASVIEYTGLNWEPYLVETSDGWQISVFRIYGDSTDSEKLPVVFQGGA